MRLWLHSSICSALLGVTVGIVVPVLPGYPQQGAAVLRVFYVSIHEGVNINAIFDMLRELNETYKRVRIGLLFNWGKFRGNRLLLFMARKYELPVMVDHGGFQWGSLGLDMVEKYAVWLRANSHLYDYALMPDVVAAKHPTLDISHNVRAASATARLHDRFYALAHSVSEKLVPVAQGGYPPSLYISMINYYIESGLAVSGLVALGSAKVWQRRSRWRETKGKLKHLIRMLDRVFSGRVRLHLLGIHGLDLREVLGFDVVYSADSGSQGLNYKYKWRSVLGCRSLDGECYAKSIAYEVRLALDPLRNRELGDRDVRNHSRR